MISRSRRGAPLFIVAIALVILAGVAITVAVIDPLPPRRVLMATGPEGGAYAPVAKRYQEILARHGVRLDLVATQGSLENLARLGDPRTGVSVALLQGGVTSAQESPGLTALGTVFHEPIWVFARASVPLVAGRFPRGTRVCMGMPGSGTRKLAGEILFAVGNVEGDVELRALDPEPAAAALQQGELDVAGFVMAWEAPVVRRLLADPSLRVLDWERADAHVALRPYLEKVRVPRGVADLARDIPAEDLTLVAPKASLVVREDLNPALQFLLLEAAVEVHGGPGIFHRAGTFPAAEPMDFPLSEYARQYYRSGRPFLQRYLPFWMAVFAARILLLLIPVAGVLYPLFRLLPAGYFWWMRRRIYRLYRELKQIDAERGLRAASVPVPELSRRLEALEQRADRLQVPASLTHLLFTLRDHIGVVRRRLE